MQVLIKVNRIGYRSEASTLTVCPPEFPREVDNSNDVTWPATWFGCDLHTGAKSSGDTGCAPFAGLGGRHPISAASGCPLSVLVRSELVNFG